jgi:hypothetical protein
MGVNWERMEDLYEHLLLSKNFDLSHWWYDVPQLGAASRVDGEVNWCGTTACIAGHAISMWPNELWGPEVDGVVVINDEYHTEEISEVAAKLLGISEMEANWLFCAVTDSSYDTEDERGFFTSVEIHKIAAGDGQVFATDEAASLAYMKECIRVREVLDPGSFFLRRGDLSHDGAGGE